MMFKYYPDADPGIWNPERLAEFMGEHLRDCQKWWGLELPPGGGFDLVNEDEALGGPFHSLGGPSRRRDPEET